MTEISFSDNRLQAWERTAELVSEMSEGLDWVRKYTRDLSRIASNSRRLLASEARGIDQGLCS
jgi:hypothetical protein